MSNSTITQLPQAISITGAEFMEIVQAGTSMRLQIALVAALGAQPTSNVVRTNSTNYAVTATDQSIAFNGLSATTITLPSAALSPGREIIIKVESSVTVVSASANVIPLAGTGPTTAILAATPGKFAFLKSDGTNWTTMMAN